MDDLISRQAAIDEVERWLCDRDDNRSVERMLRDLPSAQPERLTDDDFETIRIHLNAYKENLCNQHGWKEAEEYQRIIGRFMAFASTESERKKGKWIKNDFYEDALMCSCCRAYLDKEDWSRHYFYFCYHCGAFMEGMEVEQPDDPR